jgi:hypothetical protein
LDCSATNIGDEKRAMMAPIPKPLHELPLSWVGAGIHTLDASRWTLWMARLFGRRFESEDTGHQWIGYEWRGKFYLTDYREPR